MADLVSFFSLSTLFLLLAGATNTNNGSLAMKAYWNEVFPGIPIPDVIRALLPSPTQTSGLVGRGYGNVDIVVKSSRSWIRLWSVLGDAHNDRSNNWSPNLAPLYFLRKDLLSGSKMNVTMMITPSANEASTVGGVSSEPTFLPRKQAHEIPFSTSNLTTILKMFSIEPHSHHASLTRQTLVDCKMPALKGELKYCATSLESMIDFVVAEFGTNEIHAAITSVVNREEEVKARIYRVGVGGGRVISHKAVTCHNMMFPYAVFYCHNLAGTRAYMVPLVSDDGSRVNAVALCHFDTSSWNPGHASFRLLGVKPGTVPICHFILKDLAWVPN